MLHLMTHNGEHWVNSMLIFQYGMTWVSFEMVRPKRDMGRRFFSW